MIVITIIIIIIIIIIITIIVDSQVAEVPGEREEKGRAVGNLTSQAVCTYMYALIHTSLSLALSEYIYIYIYI